MLSEKEVINECLLVNYVEDCDGKKLVICRSKANKDPIIRIWHDEKSKHLYLKVLELVNFGRINKEDLEE